MSQWRIDHLAPAGRIARRIRDSSWAEEFDDHLPQGDFALHIESVHSGRIEDKRDALTDCRFRV